MTDRPILQSIKQGLFDMSNIILEEVRAGGKEAKQDINELRDMFNIKKVRLHRVQGSDGIK